MLNFLRYTKMFNKIKVKKYHQKFLGKIDAVEPTVEIFQFQNVYLNLFII